MSIASPSCPLLARKLHIIRTPKHNRIYSVPQQSKWVECCWFTIEKRCGNDRTKNEPLGHDPLTHLYRLAGIRLIENFEKMLDKWTKNEIQSTYVGLPFQLKWPKSNVSNIFKYICLIQHLLFGLFSEWHKGPCHPWLLPLIWI